MQVEETTPSTPLRPTRAGFVRGLPLTMPVEEVIERGREVGIELQPSDIHAARYYMRQVAAADGSSIPQQLLLGGTFVTKREPRGGRGANSANGANGAAGKAASSSGEKAAPLQATQISLDTEERLGDEDEDEDEAKVAVTREVKRRGRPAKANGASVAAAVAKGSKGKGLKAQAHAKAKAEPAEKPTNGLHSRLQARLRNATFRDTTGREEREDSRQAARQEKQEKADKKAKLSAGKALLLGLDNALKQPKSKRAIQTAEALEAQLRLIALRVGTQRVREILDEMEELARRA